MRKEAVYALGVLGDQAPIVVLLEATQDEDSSVRQAAVEVLAGLSPALLPVEQMLKLLQQSAPLFMSTSQNSIRLTIIRVLGNLGGQIPAVAVNVLQKALEDRYPQVVLAAVEALQRLKIQPSLQPLLTHRDLTITRSRTLIVRAISKLGEQAMRAALLAPTQESPVWEQEAAVAVLAECETVDAAESLRVALREKHILVQIAAMAAMSKHPDLQADIPRAALPLFLSLPDLARSGLDLPAYLAQQVAGLGLETGAGQALVQAIEQGRVFVCLDSLDEVLPRLRAGIIRQINTLAHRHGNSWIVGSRFTDYKGDQFEPGHFQEWELQPLDEVRRLHLATHLLPAIQRQLSPHATDTPSIDPGAYMRALGEHRQAASWGENPLLFSLAAAVYLRRGTLAGSRSLLYREVIEAVLEARHPDPQQRVHLCAILAEIALELYQIKGRTFHASDLRATLSKINSEQRAAWSVEPMLAALLSSGVLNVVSSETYSFRHQTFQEYLAASAPASRFMSDDEQTRAAGQHFAWSKHTYSRWHEIQRLLAGILVQEYGAVGVAQARTWLERLLQQQESPGGDPGNLNLELAIKLLSEVADLEGWPGTKTLALEEMAVALWSREVLKWQETSQRSQRHQSIAKDIGSFSPIAQRRAFEALLRAYIDGGRHGLIDIIGALRSHETTRYLLEMLARFSNPYQQRRIKHLFGRLGGFAPIDLLLEELRSDRDDESHLASIALVQLAPLVSAERIVPVLFLKGFGRPDAARNILKAIAKTRALPLHDLLPLLESQDREAAFYAAEVLAAGHHPAAISFLLTYLRTPDKNQHSTVLRSLRSCKTLLPVDHIFPLIDDKDADMRRVAVEILANVRSARTLEALHRAASDPDREVRLEALKTLGTWHDPSSFDLLMQATNDTSPDVVREALTALGAYGPHAPLELLHDPHPDVRAAAAQALVRYPDEAPLDELYAAATFDESGHVRRQAATTLGKLGKRDPERAAAGILHLFDDERASYEEGEVASQAFAELGAALPADMLLPAIHTCGIGAFQAALALGQMGERAPVEQLVLALQDQDDEVRRMAVVALAQMGKHAPIPDLLIALRAKNVPGVRREVIKALATLSTYGNVPDEVFLKKIFKKHDYSTYLLRVFTRCQLIGL